MLEPDQPLTAPTGPDDPRAPLLTDNQFQVAQGGRYFSWYGCSGCHGAEAKGVRDLADRRWQRGSTIDAVYRMIARGHGVLGQRIPVEQVWQLSAYVMNLPKLEPDHRRRQDADQVGEPRGAAWQGPVE